MKYKWFKIITLASSLEENTVYLQDFIENQFNKIAITIMPNNNGWNYLEVISNFEV